MARLKETGGDWGRGRARWAAGRRLSWAGGGREGQQGCKSFGVKFRSKRCKRFGVNVCNFCKRFGVKKARGENLWAKKEGVWAKMGVWANNAFVCKKRVFVGKENSIISAMCHCAVRRLSEMNPAFLPAAGVEIK